MRSSFQQFGLHLYQRCADSLSTDSKILLEASLSNDADGVSFGYLKADPGRVGLESVLKKIEKLNFIRSLHLPVDMFASFSTKVLQRYRQRVNSETAWEMRQHPWATRYGLYAVFLYCYQREIIDGLIEPFIQIVHRLSARSKRRLVKTLFADFQRVHRKTALLFRIAEVDLNNTDGLVKEVVYPVTGEDALKSLLKEFKSSDPTYQILERGIS